MISLCGLRPHRAKKPRKPQPGVTPFLDTLSRMPEQVPLLSQERMIPNIERPPPLAYHTSPFRSPQAARKIASDLPHLPESERRKWRRNSSWSSATCYKTNGRRFIDCRAFYSREHARRKRLSHGKPFTPVLEIIREVDASRARQQRG